MNVVDLCPVGALTSKDFRFSQRVWFLKTTPSACHGCAKACSIHIDHNREKYKEERIYRFRPRENPDVNGFFICDEGRLSYKALQENRQRERIVDGKPISEKEALLAYAELVESTKGKVVVLADPNLYLEELLMIQSYARSLGASLHAPLASYLDDSFGDDWLKSSQRAANAKGVEKLGISTELPEDEDIALLIDFNHQDAASIEAKQTISFRTHRREGEAALVLPLAVFSESEGTLLNEDGIEQYCAKAIEPEKTVRSAIDWIGKFEGGAV
jgi:NADH-quinone oxidoreductase subunit G